MCDRGTVPDLHACVVQHDPSGARFGLTPGLTVLAAKTEGCADPQPGTEKVLPVAAVKARRQVIGQARSGTGDEIGVGAANRSTARPSAMTSSAGANPVDNTLVSLKRYDTVTAGALYARGSGDFAQPQGHRFRRHREPPLRHRADVLSHGRMTDEAVSGHEKTLANLSLTRVFIGSGRRI